LKNHRFPRPWKRWLSYDNAFILIVLIVFVVLCFIPTGFEGSLAGNSTLSRGEVVEADNSRVAEFGIVKTGDQKLQVKMSDGPFEGEVITAYNTLLGKAELDEFYEVGDSVLVVVSTDEQGGVAIARAKGHYRITIELILFAIFAVFLIIFAGRTGARALLSLLFTALVIWKILLPGVLKGYDPVLIALGIVTLLNVVILYLVGGVNRKGTVAFLGASLGIMLTCGLAFLFGSHFHLSGAVRPFAETLVYSGYINLNLGRIFLAGIFIASSGAVMDLAMDVATAMNEVVLKKPGISVRETIGSGFAVGRAVVGTMVTTLILAYSSTYMTMMMVFMAQGIPLSIMFNMNYVAAEFLNIVVGSFGLVTVAPFTALMGGIIYVKMKKR